MSSGVYRKVDSSRKREAYLIGVCWYSQQRWAQAVRLGRLLLEWEEHTGLLIIVNIRIVCEMGVTQRGVM